MESKSLPANVKAYRKTPVFRADNVPHGLLREHRTKAGVWGLIHVVDGTLRYCMAASGEDIVLSAGQTAVIEPEVAHYVALLDACAFYVEFWR